MAHESTMPAAGPIHPYQFGLSAIIHLAVDRLSRDACGSLRL
jgi:hypothetical protein